MDTAGLTVVATPIGNLADVGARAREVLRDVDVIAAEDTRRVRKLLSALGIPAGDRLVSLHEHNERAQIPALLEELERGREVALVSDAGMPTISDPGQDLVAACAESGIEVRVVPGPSSVVAALAGSGLPAGRFVFEGFPPRKGRERRDWLAAMRAETRTIVIFEAPSRARTTLGELSDVLGPDRRAVLCREMTKLHEEYVRGSLAELASAPWTELGEMVIVVEGAGEVESGVPDVELRAWLSSRLHEGLSVREASAEAVAALGVRRNRAYRMALDLSPGKGTGAEGSDVGGE